MPVNINLNNVQPTLVSGTNIKTVNTNSLLGSGNISVGTVTSVAALTVGTTGTDLSSTVATRTSTPVITLNVPTASATNRGALSSTDWTTFNNKVSTGAITTSGLTMDTSRLLGRTTAANGAVEYISIGTGLTLTGGTLSATGGGITVGTTAVTSGTIGRVFFQGTGNVVQQSASLFWDNTNSRLGVGATPSASVRLDVRAQGALSTDIAFRVRNSADNDNIIQVNGDMSLNLLGTATGGYINVARTTGGNVRMRHRATAVLPSIFQIHSFGDGGSVGQIQFDTFDGVTPGFTMQRLISGLSDLTGATLYSGFGTNAATFVMKNALNYGGYGVVPTGTAADHFAMYSADIVAGNAAPHFRTENGNIIKLYQQSSAGITTVAQLVTVMQNLGLLS